jgi:hypothetical protein
MENAAFVLWQLPAFFGHSPCRCIPGANLKSESDFVQDDTANTNSPFGESFLSLILLDIGFPMAISE